MHYKDSCIQKSEGSAGSNVFSDRRQEFLNYCRSEPVRRIRTTLRM